MGDVIAFPGAQRALPGMPAPAVPAPLRVAKTPPAKTCWNCANTRGTPARGERYCTKCQLRGEDSPLVPCKFDGCNTVARRRWPGQQFFDCNRHQDAQNEKTALDDGEAENV